MSGDEKPGKKPVPWEREPVPDPWPLPEVAAIVVEPDDERVPTNARRAWQRGMDLGCDTAVITYARGTVPWEEQAPKGAAARVRRVLASTRVVDSVMVWLEHGSVRAWLAWENGAAHGSGLDGAAFEDQAGVWAHLGQGAVWVALEGGLKN